ncbi:hypothetical protein FRC02_001083 [Tulasnella sp. 418]|nr:hypothetical protein FRC02_001083 [Tulasnella sp. 418]
MALPLATTFLLFVAFLLLLLVSVSLPIAKSIWLFVIGSEVEIGSGLVQARANGEVKFGVWGYCISAIEARALGITQSIPGECSSPRLGYKIDDRVASIFNATGNNDILDVINRALTFVLVLHPIACALTFLALLFALFLVFRPGKGRITSILVTIITLLAALLTTLVFIIDIVLVQVVKSRLKSATEGNAYAKWGPIPWMTLGAAIALWIATVMSCLGIFRGRRK